MTPEDVIEKVAKNYRATPREIDRLRNTPEERVVRTIEGVKAHMRANLRFDDGLRPERRLVMASLPIFYLVPEAGMRAQRIQGAAPAGAEFRRDTLQNRRQFAFRRVGGICCRGGRPVDQRIHQLRVVGGLPLREIEIVVVARFGRVAGESLESLVGRMNGRH